MPPALVGLGYKDIIVLNVMLPRYHCLSFHTTTGSSIGLSQCKWCSNHDVHSWKHLTSKHRTKPGQMDF
jgi:hypothetical protein